MTRNDSAVGCVLGTAVGDALGLACEGLSRTRQLKWFPSLDGYHLIAGRGMCSDDTEHTCMLAQSIIASGGNVEKFERDFAWRLRWWFCGLPAGIGLATLRSIVKLWLFVPNRWRGVFSAGNGPAMRSALLGVLFGDDEATLLALNGRAARLTHRDPKAEFGALAVALAARASSRGAGYDDFLADLGRLAVPFGDAGAELVRLAERAGRSAASGESTPAFMAGLGCGQGVSGYMYHSLPAVFHAWCCHPRDFRSALTAAIRCGGDTDTIAAMVGAIVGAGVGRQGIPGRWLNDLIEWPRTVGWMDRLAIRAADAADKRTPAAPQALSIAGLLVRNALFMTIVLAHGVRRLLPPY